MQNTDLAHGLTSTEAEYRRRMHGPNELGSDEEESLITKFVEQFKNPLILLLLGSAAISVLFGHYDDAVSITLAILIVVTVAFVQEYQSEKSLKALNKLVPNYCNVLRNGSLRRSLASELVPGDIVRFSTGDRVPADVRIAECVDLQIDESSLTGENRPREKSFDAVDSYSESLPLAERNNIGFMGTLIRNGHGTGVVIATGKETEIGILFKMMKEVDDKRTPLQHNMDTLGKQLSMLSFGIIVLIVIIGVYQGRKLLEMFTIAVSLAVAAIPEGLPIVVTVTLALGVLRMSKRHAIIKKLPSVESLGSVNVLCVDKTGTITRNEMTITAWFTVAENRVRHVPSSGNVDIEASQSIELLTRIGFLCNNARIDENGDAVGQPTEVALLEFGRRAGLRDEREGYTRISEMPFNSERKCMSVLAKEESGSGDTLYFVKGSFEAVLSKCTRVYGTNGEIRPLDATTREQVRLHSVEVAHMGLRCLFCAYGREPTALTFVGFFGMQDPPRAGVSDCISTLNSGGVRVIMITGDSGETAAAIAQQVGISLGAVGKSMVSGQELDALHDMNLESIVEQVNVFYRATPKHKMAIVRALQSNGYIVAMTGDGVNDAPALKLADIGISMGKSGTDVSKEAADMILVDDELSTILHAIEEGKSIFYNIQNFLRFQLSTSVSALTLIALSTLFGMVNPLNAMQILWINIICDGPVAQSLGVEAVDPDIMKQPPRNKNDTIVTRSFINRVLTSAVVIVIGTLSVFYHEISGHGVTARATTMTFTCFVFFDMFNAAACRSMTHSVFAIGVFSNKMFNLAVGACVLGQLAVVYVPFLRSVFLTEPLSLSDLLFLVCLASSVLWVDEARKSITAGGPLFGLVGAGVRRRWLSGYSAVRKTDDDGV
ncbi:PMR1-type calcium-transporting P-type ATPase [Zopfochytrium polystomum]|nr:PMR1-type calcium-transporting P-type ATPase [Zopfochytrium polystomum]